MYKQEKVEEWKPEGIITDKGIDEHFVPYGNEQDMLVPGLHYPSPSGGGQTAIGTFTITGTGNKAVTGIGFTPSLVRMTVGDGSGSVGFTGSGAMTTTSQHAMNNTNSTQITTQCIYYGNPVGARAVYVSMDSDGFTVNCTAFSTTTYVNFEAFA